MQSARLLAVFVLTVFLYPSVAPAAVGIAKPKQDHAPDRLIVRLHHHVEVVPAQHGPGVARLAGMGNALAQLNADLDATYERLHTTATDNLGLDRLFVVDLKHHEGDLLRTAQRFADTPDVVYAEPDWIVVAQNAVPDDPFFASSGTWGQDYEDLWGLHRMNASAAWAISHGAPEVVVAVVDTGLDINHPDIADNVFVNPNEIPGNGIDDDGNGFVDDIHGWDFVGNQPHMTDGNGHGTHVAGTIAAVGNNALGVVGVTWNCKILSCRSLNDDGNGLLSDMVRAILYAADMNADVINNSWSNSQAMAAPQSLIEAVQYADSRNCVVVAAASNYAKDVGTVAHGYFPASIEPAICVSAMNATEELASFSNFGARVNVTAPGVDTLSLLAAGSQFATHPSFQPLHVANDYLRISGTSMSAPHVAGAAALLRTLSPGLNPRKVRGLIELTARDIGDPGRDDSFGWGLVDLARLLEYAPHPNAQIASPQFDGLLPSTLPVDIVGTVTGEGLLDYSIYFQPLDASQSPVVIGGGTQPVQDGSLTQWTTLPAQQGDYVLRLYARYSGNVVRADLVRVRISDSHIKTPVQGVTLRQAQVAVTGTAAGVGFTSFTLAHRRNGLSTWTTFRTSNTPVVDDTLGTWTLSGLRDAVYDLRLVVNYGGGTRTHVQQILLDGLRNEIVEPGHATLVRGQTDIKGSGSSLTTGFQRRLRYFPGFEDYSYSNSVGLYQSIDVELLHEGSDMVHDGTLHDWNADNSAAGFGLLTQRAIDSANPADQITQMVFNDTTNVPIRPGYPRSTGALRITGALTPVDLDGNGVMELVGTGLTHESAIPFVGYEYKNSVYIWRLDGSDYPGWEGGKQLGFGPYATNVTLGELDGDAHPEIIAMDNDRLYAWNHDGTVVPGWEGGRFLAARGGTTGRYGISCPVLADLDGDGLDEIIVDTEQTFVVRPDGTNYPGWPRPTGITGGQYKYASMPAVGDLDGDGLPDIVTANQDNPRQLYAWNRNGALLPGFPVDLATWGFGLASGPVLADLQGSGQTSIWLTVGHRLVQVSSGGQATVRDTWSSYHGGADSSGIVVANLDDDPELELFVPCTSNNLYFYMSRMAVYDDDAQRLWEQEWRATSAINVPGIATDIDGDGRAEVIGPIGDRVYARDSLTGANLPNWPAGALSSVVGAPVVADLDGDGDIELAYGDFAGVLYIWDLDAPYDPETAEWTQLRGSRGRAGVYLPPRLEPTPTPTATPTATFTPTHTATPTSTPWVWHGISAH